MVLWTIIYLIVNSSIEVAAVKSEGYSEVSFGDFEETVAKLVTKAYKSDPTVVELLAILILILTTRSQDFKLVVINTQYSTYQFGHNHQGPVFIRRTFCYYGGFPSTTGVT